MITFTLVDISLARSLSLAPAALIHICAFKPFLLGFNFNLYLS